MRRFLTIGAILFLALASQGCGVSMIEDGQAGIKADFGKIMDQPIETGWHFYIPAVSWIEVWSASLPSEVRMMPSAACTAVLLKYAFSVAGLAMIESQMP